MSTGNLQLPREILDLIDSYKAKAADGLTWPEFLQLLDEFTLAAMKVAERLRNLTGEQKKALVLQAVGLLFDRFMPVITIALPWYLAWLAPVVNTVLRQVVLATASALIEQLYAAKFQPAS